MSSISRRDFLRSVAAGGTALAVAGQSSLVWSADDWGGFKMGLQSYTLREFDTAAALEHTVKFGLKYWESFAKHFPISTLPKSTDAYKKQLSDSGVQMLAFGVVGFDTNETKAREIFDFAKAMGMMSIFPRGNGLLSRFLRAVRALCAVANRSKMRPESPAGQAGSRATR